MTDPIDYSRPVGWWCPVCGHDETETDVDVLWNLPDWLAGYDAHNRLVPIHLCTESGWCIPRYLPIPEGQRPPAASEVEEAEVCTGRRVDAGRCCYVSADAALAPDDGWLASLVHLSEYANAGHINDIARASARARIVTGATE